MPPCALIDGDRERERHTYYKEDGVFEHKIGLMGRKVQKPN